MKPKAVLVETNWVVDVVAPAHLQSPQAIQLLLRAQAGEFQLFVPAICFAEARETVPRRFTPRSRSEDLRKFVRWARDEGQVSAEDAKTAFRVFDKFDGLVATELGKTSERLDALMTRLWTKSVFVRRNADVVGVAANENQKLTSGFMGIFC